ncbi:hypothetical protein ACFVS2_20105 [Brevibacillus sp. NPDC058079]|uniref:hypothetical protein n=1 Tax=Brevibacillus sp. NPDC058079 TaxID=3346330 RepID=UPI0036F11414
MGVSAIGIMLGALLSTKIIPLVKQDRLYYLGIGMAVAIAIVGFLPYTIVTGTILFVAGFFGGVYIIPLNTTLQSEGNQVGAGKVIAIQNFCENLLMLSSTLLYTGALKIGMDIPSILVAFATIFFGVVLYVRIAFMKPEMQ